MNKKKQHGMSIIELVITMVIIGIISSIAVSKMGSPASLTVGEQATQFVSQIRYAQYLAQSWGCQLAVVVTTTSYEIRNKNIVTGKPRCSAANTVITDPANGKNLTAILDNGVQFGTAGTFDFDIKGVPRDNGTNAIIAVATTFTLTGGSNNYVISISDITGYVSMTGP